MVYKEKPTDKMKYENIYIGQSIHVYQRVRQYLKGHGNWNVYQSWKNGREVYITFIYCNKKKLNVLEKRLIRIFHATDSFNVQKDDKEVEVYVQEISYYRVFFDWREDDGGKNKIRRLCEAPSKMAG